MSLHLTSDTLAGAVQRLSTSNAKPVLCDFLILKHAMSHGDGTATLSPRNETYMDAMTALASVHTVDGEAIPPFFNPFGTAREKNRSGWRSKKYPSNGPPVTVAGANWQKVIEIIGERPRRVSFAEEYVEHLPSVVLTSDGEPPLAEDCATWFYRAEDLEPYVEAGDTAESLTGPFLSEVGLNPEEQAAIFQRQR